MGGGVMVQVDSHNASTGKKIVDSIDLLKWEVLKTHIDSISGNSTSHPYIQMLAGQKFSS